MKRYFTFLLILCNTIVYAQNWQPLPGFNSGAVSCFAENSSGQLFSGTWSGNIYFSDDDGVNWTAVPIGISDVLSIEDIYITSGDTIYTATSGAGIIRSVNNGDTWTQINNGIANPSINDFIVANSNGDLFTNASDGGLYRSIDEGQSWDLLNPASLLGSFVFDMAINNAGDIFIGTLSNGVLLSHDNGDTWSQVGPPDVYIASIALNSTGEVFCGSENSDDLIRLDPDGSSYTTLPVWNPTEGSGVFDILIRDNDDILLATGGDGILASTDNGGSWFEMNDDLFDRSILTIMERNGTNGLITGTNYGNGIYTMGSQASSWVINNEGLKSAYIPAMETDATGRVFAAAYNLGLFRLQNDDSWSEVGNAVNLSRVITLKKAPNGTLLAGGAPTDNAPENMFRSTDDGNTWEAIGAELAGLRIDDIEINTSGVVFASAGSDGIFRSNDNGDSWTLVNTGMNCTAVSAIAINSSDVIFAGMRNCTNRIYRSDDDGDTWTSVYTGSGNSYVFSLGFDSNDVLYVSGVEPGAEWSGVYRSDDNGATWSQINDGFGNTFTKIDVYAVEPSNNDFYAAGGSGLFLLEDGQSTWVEQTGLPTNASVSSLLIGSGTYLYAGTDGNGVYRSMQPVGINEASERNYYSLSQNFPNPCTDWTEIPFNLERPADVELKIHDILGRNQISLNVGKVTVGEHTIRVDVSKLKAGIYLYTLKVDGSQFTKKMIVN